MDPVTAALIGILLIIVIGGVWGLTIISGVMDRRLKEAGGGISEAQLEALQASHDALEARLGQVEDELGFLQALHAPASSSELPNPDDSER